MPDYNTPRFIIPSTIRFPRSPFVQTVRESIISKHNDDSDPVLATGFRTNYVFGFGRRQPTEIAKARYFKAEVSTAAEALTRQIRYKHSHLSHCLCFLSPSVQSGQTPAPRRRLYRRLPIKHINTYWYLCGIRIFRLTFAYRAVQG